MAPFVSREIEHVLERRFVNGSSAVLELGVHPYGLLNTWIILYSIGQALLLFLLATILFTREQRCRTRPTFTNMILATFLGTIPPCILSVLCWSGGESEPSDWTMSSPSGIQARFRSDDSRGAFCTHSRHSFDDQGHSPVTLGLQSIYLDYDFAPCLSLHHFPYLVHSCYFCKSDSSKCFILPICLPKLGLDDLPKIYRIEESFYCTLQDDVYGNITALFGVAVILATIGCECYTIITLRRAWCAVRELRMSKNIDISLIIRAGVVTAMEVFFVFVTIAATVADSKNMITNDVSTVFEAIAPIAIFVSFGIRPDLIRIWMFWRTESSWTESVTASSDIDIPNKYIHPQDTTQSDFGIP